jgi:serine/threonine-protein kinase
MHVNSQVPRISSLVDNVPQALDDLIYRATRVDPDERPRDAQVFHAELLAISHSINPSAPQLSLELDIPIAPMREKSKKRSEKIASVESTVKSIETTDLVKARKKVSSRVRRNRWIAAALALVLVVTGWWVLAGPGASVKFPSVVGATVEQANTTLTALGLEATIAQELFDEDIPKGRVLSTDPSAGDSIDPGGVVLLTVSKGAERFAVPSLTKMTTEAALKILAETPLRAGDVTEVFSDKIAKGLVISSNPENGTQVKRDTLIDLVVSKGIETFDLASYVGKNGDQALNELTDAGFTVTPTYVYDEVVMPGEVISQKPAAGVALPAGAKVELFISQGSAFVFIPNILRYTQERAVTVLQDLGLTVVVKKVTKTSKVVIGINPKVNTKVKRGTTVTITVG